MQKKVSFQLEDAVEVPHWADAYPQHKFVVYKCCFLSTAVNSHKIPISDELLHRDAHTILGNFLVARVLWGDATTHNEKEMPYGYFPTGQEVEFVEDNGITKAYAYAVVSKRYSKEFNSIFEFDNVRNASVEMTVSYANEDDEDSVDGFDIYSLCVLGKTVNGSCPDANIKLVRFSEKKAEEFFKKNDGLSTLKKFAQERYKKMAEEKKEYKIDKSKESLSDDAWGDVDKDTMRDKIMNASNKTEIVKAVYLFIEDGWEEAPSQKLKYPVMQLKGDTFVYNRGALASALAYAKQHDETAVVNKVEEIYKDLDIEIERKEETKMNEIEFAAVDIGNLWGKLYDALREKYPMGTYDSEYRIDGIYEEANKKFAIIYRNNEDVKFRLNFSLTEEGLTLSDEITKVEVQIVETDDIRKFAAVEDGELMKKYTQFEDCGCGEDGDKDNHEEEMAKMQKTLEDKENIIMEKDKMIAEMAQELEELRAYKNSVLEKEKATSVEAILAEVSKCLTEEQCQNFRAEGLACDMAELDGWANKVRAIAFTVVSHKSNKTEQGLLTFSAPVQSIISKSGDIWERLGNKYHK